MRPIPKKMREQMCKDPYYQYCCYTGLKKGEVKIEWHHNLQYAGRQVNEVWAILPLSEAIHIQARNTKIKEKLDWIMLNRATDEELMKYDRANLIEKRAMLNRVYGGPKQNDIFS